MSNAILIVDDNESYGVFLSLLLRRQRFEAHHANSAQKALDLLKGTRFDAVITDIYMPECDGIELLRRIKEQKPEMPVLGMTADDGLLPTIDRVFRYSGGLAVVRKPTNNAGLVAMLSTLAVLRQLA